MLPILLKEENTRVLVFGYGKSAKLKIKGLQRAGMNITVIAPNAALSDISCIKDIYHPSYLKLADIIIAATDDEIVNKKIVCDCKSKGKLVLNLMDSTNSNFEMMSFRQKGSITLALSTGKKLPTESKRLIEKLSSAIEESDIEIVNVLSSIRMKLKDMGKAEKISSISSYSIEELKRLDTLSLEDLKREVYEENNRWNKRK